MNEIYAIFNGEYSDWNCLGFFTDELKAEKYCTMKNESNDEDCYIMKIDNLTKVDLSNIKPKYVYCFSETFADFYSDSHVEILNRHKQGVEKLRYARVDNVKYKITVIINEKNRDKAVKIAQDIFAKYKAEQSGI